MNTVVSQLPSRQHLPHPRSTPGWAPRVGTPEFAHNAPPQHPLEGCERLLGVEFSTQPPPTLLSLFPLFIFLKKRSLDLKKRRLDLKKALGVEGVEEAGSKKEGEARQMKTRIKKNQSQGYRKGRCLSTTLNFVKFWSVLVSHSDCACPHPRARHRWVHGWVKHYKKKCTGPKKEEK